MADIAETTSTGRRTVTGLGFALAGGGCLLTVASLVLDVTEARTDRALAIAVQLLCTLLPIALGLFRLRKSPDDRFARLLIVAGLSWSVMTFAQSSNSALYSVGRLSVWAVEVMIVYLLLAFPD